MCSELTRKVLFLIGVTRDFFDTTPSFLRYVRDMCARDASTRVRMIAGSTDTRAIVWTMRSGGRVAHAGASHAYPDPRGHRYLGSGFTRRKHTYFSRRRGGL